MKKLSTFIGLLAAIFSLKEALSKDEHVQSVVNWLYNASTKQAPALHSLELQFISIFTAFAKTTPSAWYTWIVVCLVISVLIFLILVIGSWISWGSLDRDDVSDAVIPAAGICIGVFLLKVVWLFFAHGTLLWILIGVALLVLLIWGVIELFALS
ncbi:hypothetical protein [Mucilaginibacter ginsenosidivorans]|uniref:Uncharacterized protein n=1 Tax=Mucilaginibacter ginsenosidivorans TaxID=398053 RepID=A0A5B8V243_9SPHI|nr:hypothetical protein [Mucilaginibacter ginsenosidivorans]QEC65332.1 hypothetical protein FRZ54_23085 [Mucilaginibacter ginsenosidivorans]